MRRFKHMLLILALTVLVAPAAPHGASSAGAEAAVVPEAAAETSAESQVIIKWYGYWDYVWGDCPWFCSWFESNPLCDCVVIYIKI